MSDRELLELAAKAIGGSYWHDARTFSDYLVIEQDEPAKWNPLTDDGDALRLAVKLGLDILFTPEDVEVIADQHAKEDGGETVAPWAGESWTLKQQDPYAATRRAIVRTAAEIGKGMVAQQSGKELPEDDYYKSQAEAFYGGKS